MTRTPFATFCIVLGAVGTTVAALGGGGQLGNWIAAGVSVGIAVVYFAKADRS